MAMAPSGQTEPSGFVVGAAGLASIADAVEAWRSSTVGYITPTSAPQYRNPRLTAAVPAPGHHAGVKTQVSC
jgi:hypothetical protein